MQNYLRCGARPTWTGVALESAHGRAVDKDLDNAIGIRLPLGRFFRGVLLLLPFLRQPRKDSCRANDIQENKRS